jgi:hypothetical protein
MSQIQRETRHQTGASMDYCYRDYAPGDPTEVIYCTKDHKFRYMKRSELFDEHGRLSNTLRAPISISLPNVSRC